eukprot:TRINITY_DN23398_c0_g1_i1.p1 TRINITY_DN23398_c0_g1~~TRINITY_DN23398_c0_g1_i1.p1  ORF type:complete len:253 (-),score=29.04 TRINITY_DN23398_c0_g1_i1:322-1080(-)
MSLQFRFYRKQATAQRWHGRANLAFSACIAACFAASSLAVLLTGVTAAFSCVGAAHWTLREHGLECVRLPLDSADELALQAGLESSILKNWNPIKNGDGHKGRRQSPLGSISHAGSFDCAVGEATRSVIMAVRGLACSILGSATQVNDLVVISDFGADLTRQVLHRDVDRQAVDSTTHGMLVPLSKGCRLHFVPRSHAPRQSLRGEFAQDEVLCTSVQPGCALLWDGMLVHAGDMAAPGSSHSASRPRLHAS